MSKSSLRPGTLLVLEGLDKTGKSTQSEALRWVLDPATTHHMHMPSGVSGFTNGTYDMLESADRAPSNGLAKQLAHLACHAESVPHLRHLLTAHAVVLDRWWWSTFAYGWFAGDIPQAGINEPAFRNLVESIWAPLTASVVFLFDKPYQVDANNADPVLEGYNQLAAEYQHTVRVPHGDPTEITGLLLAEVRRHGLLMP